MPEYSLLKNAFIFAIVTSIVASIVFLLVMFMLRNTLIISSNICRQKDEQTGQNRYYIKIINLSPLKLFDVKLSMKTLTISYGLCVGGINIKTTSVQLGKESIDCIFQYSLWRHLFMKDSWAARNCRILEILDNVDELLTDHTKLEFTLIARHSLSGFPKINVKSYNSFVNVKPGKFEHGLSCKIINPSA